MNVIPCLQDPSFATKVKAYADALKVQAHTLGAHGLSEHEFYESGIFRSAIEQIRGEYSATMREKRDFVRIVLDHMQDHGFIASWNPSGDSNRHDYTIILNDGGIAVIELKGCLDGNNTNIFERPHNAEEFIIWSVCSNPNADPRHNVWSGVHTRLSAEIVSQEKQVDGLVVWDWLCGSVARPCPKLAGGDDRITTLAQHRVPPPCIFLFPRTTPSVRNNPNPVPHSLADVRILAAMHKCFLGNDDELNEVTIKVEHLQQDVARQTTISRAGTAVRTSTLTRIRRG